MKAAVKRSLQGLALTVAVLVWGCDKGDEGGSRPKLATYADAVQFYTNNFAGQRMSPGPSKAVAGASYFSETGEDVMLVSFSKSPGRVWIYAGVPTNVWNEFSAALNKGRYYNMAIRGKYPFVLDQ